MVALVRQHFLPPIMPMPNFDGAGVGTTVVVSGVTGAGIAGWGVVGVAGFGD